MARGAKIVDLTGAKFGKLLISGISHRKKISTSSKIGGNRLFWAFVCDCGETGSVEGNNLKRGITTSCGCVRRNALANKTRTHGMRRHPAYSSWCAMKARCYRATNVGYSDYGGRGIRVCNQWQTFEKFWEDMGAGWYENASIERIDVNGNYEPGNCEWIDVVSQAKNKRNTRLIDTPNGQMRISEASAFYRVPYEVLRIRYDAGERGDVLIRPSQRQKRK